MLSACTDRQGTILAAQPATDETVFAILNADEFSGILDVSKNI
jgi:hypothetical protein